MKRAGFTMIELIFVIVILGILAAVAVPKLAATRTDAAATTALANYKTAMNDIAAYTTAQGAIPLSLSTATSPSNGIVTNGNNLDIKAGAKVCATITRTNDSNVTVADGANIDDAECALVKSEVAAGVVTVAGQVVSR